MLETNKNPMRPVTPSSVVVTLLGRNWKQRVTIFLKSEATSYFVEAGVPARTRREFWFNLVLRGMVPSSYRR